MMNPGALQSTIVDQNDLESTKLKKPLLQHHQRLTCISLFESTLPAGHKLLARRLAPAMNHPMCPAKESKVYEFGGQRNQ